MNEYKIPSMTTRYNNAKTLMQGAHGVKKLVLNTLLPPHWIGSSDCFWYQQETPEGRCFRLVDAKTQSNAPAFDHSALANALAHDTGELVHPDNLPLSHVDIELAPRVVTFNAFEKAWRYQADTETLEITTRFPANWLVSPDGKKAVFVQDFNLWMQDLDSGQQSALTQDGEEFYVYGSEPTFIGFTIGSEIDAVWSPDSKRIATTLVNSRDVRVGFPLVQHVPKDGDLCPTVLSPHRRATFFGDEAVEAWQLICIDVETTELQSLDHPPIQMNYPAYKGLFGAGRGWWSTDSRQVYFISQDNDYTQTEVWKWDTQKSSAQQLFHENPEMPAYLIPKTHSFLPILPLPETNELIWYSERSGWAHFYLYDLNTGSLKNAITNGEWVVRGLLHFDSERRELWIQTAGRSKENNPYYQDICRVNIDTGVLIPVISSDHEYSAFDKQNNTSLLDRAALAVSPSGQYAVTSRSRVDEMPVSLLLDREGTELLALETAQPTAMPTGWHWPEPINTTAADGSSDIFGLIYRPSYFSEEETYPILDYSFLSYAEPVEAFGYLNLEAMAYAELGFIVVKFFNRAITGMRDVAFRDYKYPTRPYPGMADNVAGIQQLAAERVYMDQSRVGAAIHSSLPTGLGVLVHPELYTVGVTMNPISNASLMGGIGALYGGTDYPVFEDFAGELKGKLLLIAGMLDPVCTVTNTFRLVEALQKENKSFDMLILPNLGHEISEYSDYVVKRTWDYFVEHLLGVEPPDNFQLKIWR